MFWKKLQSIIADKEVDLQRQATMYEMRVNDLKTLYERLLSGKDQTIQRLTEEANLLSNKVALMERVLMPMQSREGAALVEAQQSKPAQKPVSGTIIERTSDWKQLVAKHNLELTAEYDKEAVTPKVAKANVQKA